MVPTEVTQALVDPLMEKSVQPVAQDSIIVSANNSEPISVPHISNSGVVNIEILHPVHLSRNSVWRQVNPLCNRKKKKNESMSTFMRSNK